MFKIKTKLKRGIIITLATIFLLSFLVVGFISSQKVEAADYKFISFTMASGDTGKISYKYSLDSGVITKEDTLVQSSSGLNSGLPGYNCINSVDNCTGNTIAVFVPVKEDTSDWPDYSLLFMQASPTSKEDLTFRGVYHLSQKADVSSNKYIFVPYSGTDSDAKNLQSLNSQGIKVNVIQPQTPVPSTNLGSGTYVHIAFRPQTANQTCPDVIFHIFTLDGKSGSTQFSSTNNCQNTVVVGDSTGHQIGTVGNYNLIDYNIAGFPDLTAIFTQDNLKGQIAGNNGYEMRFAGVYKVKTSTAGSKEVDYNQVTSNTNAYIQFLIDLANKGSTENRYFNTSESYSSTETFDQAKLDADSKSVIDGATTTNAALGQYQTAQKNFELEIGVATGTSGLCPDMSTMGILDVFKGYPTNNGNSGTGTNIACLIAKGILGIAQWINGIAGPEAVQNVVVLYNVTTNDFVLRAWKSIRDFINALFVISFLIAAAATVISPIIKNKLFDNWKVQRMVPTIVGMVFLVNFSLAICSFLILFSNALCNFFLKALESNPLISSTTNNIYCYGLANVNYLYALVIAITILIMAFIFIYIYIIMWVRVIIINLLVIFSAIPYVGNILPFEQVKKYTGQWWGQFTKWLFMAPIICLFLYLTVLLMNATGAGGGGGGIAPQGGPLQKIETGGSVTPPATYLFEKNNYKPIFATASNNLNSFIGNGKTRISATQHLIYAIIRPFDEAGTVTLNGSDIGAGKNIDEGTALKFVATPKSGYKFKQWDIDSKSPNSTIVTDTTLSATVGIDDVLVYPEFETTSGAIPVGAGAVDQPAAAAAAANPVGSSSCPSSTTGGGNFSLLNLIMIIVMMYAGISFTLKAASEAGKIVDTGISKLTGGKVKGVGQAVKSAGGAVVRTPIQKARAGLWNLAKSEGTAGKALMWGVTQVQKPQMKFERAKAKAEQAKKTFGKEQAKRMPSVQKIISPTDDEVKEESEKMERYSPMALEKVMRDEKASEKERKAAAMALKKIADGKTGAFPNVEEAAKKTVDKLMKEGIQNEKGEFKDFNKPIFWGKMKDLSPNVAQSLFNRVDDPNDPKKKIDSDLILDRLANVNPIDVNNIDVDPKRLEALNNFKNDDKIKRRILEKDPNWAVASAGAVSEQDKSLIADNILKGDATPIWTTLKIAQDSDSGKAILKLVEQNRRAKLNVEVIIDRKEGEVRTNAARDTIERFEALKGSYIGKGLSERDYHQKVINDLNEIEAIKTSGGTSIDYLHKAGDQFSEIRLPLAEAESAGDQEKIDKLFDETKQKVEAWQEVSKLARDNPKEFKKLRSKGAGKGPII